jgi:hypothetical protein
MENMMNNEPEIVWCSYCGKNIWVVLTPRTQPEQLICNDCEKDKKYIMEK